MRRQLGRARSHHDGSRPPPRRHRGDRDGQLALGVLLPQSGKGGDNNGDKDDKGQKGHDNDGDGDDSGDHDGDHHQYKVGVCHWANHKYVLIFVSPQGAANHLKHHPKDKLPVNGHC